MQKQNLEYTNRCLRTQQGKLLFGPAGNRLFVDFLDKIPGFRGRIDYIHKVNLNEIFAVEVCSGFNEMDYAKAEWYPDYLKFEVKNASFALQEYKMITEDDRAISIQKWKNVSHQPLKLRFVCSPVLCRVEMEKDTTADHTEKGTALWKVTSPVTAHGYQFYFYIRSNVFHEDGIFLLAPGEEKEIICTAAFGIIGEGKETKCVERIEESLKNPGDILLRQQICEREKFRKKLPKFCCSDQGINMVWNYRWYILQNSFARPAYGNYQHGVMYEGRSHKMGKKPFAPSGWEFTKLIPLSSPMHLSELRWSGNAEYGEEIILSLLDSADAEGEFRVMTTDEFGNSYGNYSIWAYYQFYLLHPDHDFLISIIEKLKRNVDSLIRYTDGKDLLQIVKVHQLTGKEYQPSYWYFHQYPKDYSDPDTYTWLKRVDSSIYYYLNLCGISELCKLVGDQSYLQYSGKAERLKKDINDKMWDDQTGFYYDLHYKTDEKAYVKNIVGFYPWWAMIAPLEHLKGLETIFSQEFDTKYMFPSVSKNCPAYSADGGWMGNFMKGRNGCVWDGPSWPYTNAIILDALGKQSKANHHRYDAQFGKKLHKYTLQHFRNQDLSQPYLVEHYNPETGEPLSDEPDYNHSFYLELIMRYVIGLEVEKDRIIIDPLRIGIEKLECSGIRVRNHLIDIQWDETAEHVKFCIRLDGKVVHEAGEIHRVFYNV